jgi:protein-disulfide isomerase
MMITRLLVLALGLLLGLGSAASAQVKESPEGWTFGRASAPLLVEYGSLHCPTCALFSARIGPSVAAAVASGRLRYSYRPFLIFPQDRPAAVLARCVAPARRLPFLKAVLAAQPQTREKLTAADADDRARQRLFEAELAGPIRHSAVLAELAGLDRLAEAHGLSGTAVSSCLADPAHHQWVTDADMAARLAGVTGTPTFELKGRRLPRTTTPDALLAELAT